MNSLITLPATVLATTTSPAYLQPCSSIVSKVEVTAINNPSVELDKRIELLKSWIHNYPERNEQLQLYLGEMLYRYKRTDEGKLEAKQAFEKALESNPNKSQTYVWLAKTLCALNQLSRAKEVFQKALELSPNNDEAYIELGRVFILLKEPLQAKELFRKINYTLNTESPELLHKLYRMLSALQMPKHAIRIAKEIARLNPQYFIHNIKLLDPLKEYADLYLDMRDLLDFCIKMIDEHHENYKIISSQLIDITTKIQETISKKRNLQLQKNNLVINKCTVDNFSFLGIELGVTQAHLNEYEDAKATFEDVIIIKGLYSIGRSEHPKLLLGTVLLELHDFEYAAIVLEEVVKTVPGHSQAQELLLNAKARYNDELQIANTNAPKIEHLENHECIEDSLLDTLEVIALCNEHFGSSELL